MPRRIFLTAAAFFLWSCLPALSADAEERVAFQNRLGVDATVTFAGRAGGETVRIQGNAPDSRTFFIAAEALGGYDLLLVQPYFDSSFQFYTPFTLDKARSMVYANLAPAGEARRLAPVLTALVGDERVSVTAGLPLRRLAALMAQGLDETGVETWLVALRLPGEQPGRYAVAIGETTWGYDADGLRFTDAPSGVKEVSELRLSASWTSKGLRRILDDMRESGLVPLLLRVEGRKAKAFGPGGLALDPQAEPGTVEPETLWPEIARQFEEAAGRTRPGAAPGITLQLASPGLRYTFSLDEGGGAGILHIVRE